MKIVAIIPARISSSRFPNKVLFDFYGLPMLEHVRRRALLAKSISDVFVATCDIEIAEKIKSFGGKVLMTSNSHTNGTSRIAEAVELIDCTHVILIQGDEPLILPRHIDDLVNSINNNPHDIAWNAISNVEEESELQNTSIVKCTLNKKNEIQFCYRKSPFKSDYVIQKQIVKILQGLLAFEKSFLMNLSKIEESFIEKYESIEQMKMIENGYKLSAVLINPSLPSVNEPSDVNSVLNHLKYDTEQNILLQKILKN